MSDEKLKLIDTPPKLTKVPAWFYEEGGGCCGLTKAALLWWMNVVCAFFHTLLAITTVIVSTLDGRSLATPTLLTYLTNLSWTDNSTNALIPKYQAANELSLSWMTIWFFLLSALAHGSVAALNYKQGWACDDTECRTVTRWTGWYFLNIHGCRNPARWLEYSFSASLMGSTLLPHQTLFVICFLI